jgi:high affinity sulfate transporter 1
MATEHAASHGSRKSGILKRYLPILEWLPQYQLSWLRYDIVAGLAVWAVLVPTSMAYAGIAGVPPLVGLYTVPIPLIAYAIFGTSRTMVVGPDSATALISGVTVGALASQGSSDFVALTSALAMAVGVFFLVFGLLRMGWVANFICEPAMNGFIQGLVWVTVIGQVPKLFGIQGGEGNFFQKLWDIFGRLPEANVATTIVGLASLVLLFALKKFVPQIPSALTAVALAVIAVIVFDLDKKGVKIVGSQEAGLPPFGFPQVSLADFKGIVPGALAIVLIGYAESLGAAKAAAAKLGGKIDPNQELVSHGPANLGSAFSSGFVVVGSLSKTSVAMDAGAKTQLSNVVSAALVFLTLLFLMPLFKDLPVATLGAIVIQAILGLADFTYLKRLRGINSLEFAVAMAALFGVLILGVLEGIGLGVVLALILLIYHASYPATSELGQLPGEDHFRDISLHPEAKTHSGLLIFRFENSLFFASANHFADQVRQRIEASAEPVREVLVDCHPMNLIDTTGAGALVGLSEELRAKGVRLSLARARDPVRDRMRRTGVEKAIGEDRIYNTIADGVKAFQEWRGRHGVE